MNFFLFRKMTKELKRKLTRVLTFDCGVLFLSGSVLLGGKRFID